MRRSAWWKASMVIAVLIAPAVVLSDVSPLANPRRVVLEDFKQSEVDGFPLNWENESARSGSRAREAYRVKTEDGLNFLAVRGADQRIKKKKIDWDPKAYPVLTWRWRLQKPADGAEPIAVVYVSLDTDLLFIPVFTKYVWSGTKPEGTVSEGGMFSGTEMVVQSGREATDQWVEERVNVYEDFKRIHGHEPAAKAWGISLLGGQGVEIDVGPIVASSSSSSSASEAPVGSRIR